MQVQGLTVRQNKYLHTMILSSFKHDPDFREVYPNGLPSLAWLRDAHSQDFDVCCMQILDDEYFWNESNLPYKQFKSDFKVVIGTW